VSGKAPARTGPAPVSGPVAPATATAPAPRGAGTQPAAVVNGEPISPEQLGNECLRRFGKEVLETIVNKQLIWQECQKQGIKITEQDVEDEVQRMAAKFGLSTERWLTMLREERDINPDQYRREIIWPTIALRRLASARIQVSDEELRKAFESEYGPQVKVRMIALLDANSAAQVHKQAVANPDKFPDLAKQFSKDPNSAASRGIIPPIRKNIGEPELERVAFGLKKGEISPVIHVANQYLILKCEDHLQGTYIASQDLAKVEQRIHDQIRDNKLREAAAKLFQTLQNQAQVVNVYNDAKLSQRMPGVAATINGGSITMKQLTDECIARHGKDVLEGEINRRILDQELRRRQLQVTQQAIDEEIRRAADSYGFHRPDNSPDVEGWLKSVTETENMTVDLYVRDMVWPSVALKTIVGGKIQVTHDDLQKGFEANFGERVEVLAIVVSNQRQANQVWDMARNNPTEQFFSELANQYSVEPISRANHGKVPPIRRYGGQPVVEEEAFRLQPGELSGILGVGDKFIILRCLGRTKPVVAEFAAVREELIKDIHEKKLRLAMAEEFDRLRESAQVDNFLANTTQPGKRVNPPSPVSPAAARQPIAPGKSLPAKR
jgi:parvulin-like peptidyl-prolyl isomerase